MIKPVVFSNGQDLGDERVFDVLLVSLVYEDARFDVLGVVRNSRTKMRGTNLFKHEAEDAHVQRALQWAQQATAVPREDILRCPDFGRVLEPPPPVVVTHSRHSVAELNAHARRGRK